jgi:multiple sugar transport system ATP-binding protein
LYDHPANQFVAGFIGSPAMNFLPGVVRQGQVVLGQGLTLPVPPRARASEGQSVVYGIRPEHLNLASANDGLAAKVVVVEPTGADTQVFTQIAGVEVTSVFRERHAFSPGSTVHLQPDAQRAHLFDASSGQSLAT